MVTEIDDRTKDIDCGCRVIWSSDVKYVPDTVVSPHMHDYFQYFYVKSGGGHILIDETYYELEAQSVYLMPPGSVHEIHSSENGMVSYEIKFELSSSFPIELAQKLPSVIETSHIDIESLFESIFAETSGGEPYGDILAALKTVELVYLLIRANEQNGSTAEEDEYRRFGDEPAAKHSGYSGLIAYMNENLSETITLSMLAEMVHTEKTYFLKKFKAEVGHTPISYLRMLRINKSKKLLLHSDMSVTQISAAVGFQSIHYFTCAFKQLVGMTPTEYKNGRQQ